MVTIIPENENIIFEVNGLHKLWSFKSSITIPKNHIISAEKYDGTYWLGMRMPGTSMPGVLTAGSFYTGTDAIFCDVSNKEKAIIIYLKDEHYKKLIIEVENVEETLKSLRQ